MTSNEARSFARENQSDERFNHTEGVARAAAMLAELYGEDVERAKRAAFLHDALKEWDKGDLLQMIRRSDIIDSKTVEDCPKIYHAFAGGVYAKETLGLDDETANAIMYHTTGRYGMSRLEKIVMLADYISEERDFKGVDEVRAAAKSSLDEACLMASRNLVIHLLIMYKKVNKYSIDAYNYFVELKGDNGNV